MKIEDAAGHDKKFIERVREAVGQVGTAQIKAVISLFLQKLQEDVLEEHGALEATDLLMDDWQFCEDCEKLDMSEYMKRDAEEGVAFCKACHEKHKKEVEEVERLAKEGLA